MVLNQPKEFPSLLATYCSLLLLDSEADASIFLVRAGDDAVPGAEDSVLTYRVLKRAGMATELEVATQGGHELGVRTSTLSCSTCIAF